VIRNCKKGAAKRALFIIILRRKDVENDFEKVIGCESARILLPERCLGVKKRPYFHSITGSSSH
jgi:hypothetical protein